MPPSTYTPYANPTDNIPYLNPSAHLSLSHGLFLVCYGLFAVGLWYSLDHFIAGWGVGRTYEVSTGKLKGENRGIVYPWYLEEGG